jgi:hypothetical protein
MTYTRNTVAKGAGAVGIRRISDNRILFLNVNSRYSFNRTATEGDAVQGFNSDGNLVDLDTAGSEISYELEIASRKNTQNMNELLLDSIYTAEASYNVPWVESALVASGTVTLEGGTPVATTLYVSYLDGSKLTSTGSTPSAAGTYKDNGDGTITFHSGDNGKNIVAYYKIAKTNIASQGGANNEAVGYVDVMFHQVSGTSSTNGQKGVDVLWIPKASLSGESSLEFSEAVQEKTFTLTALIPDTPAGFKVPYIFLRNIEIDNTNAG